MKFEVINLGMEDPKMINLDINYIREEKRQYIKLFKQCKLR